MSPAVPSSAPAEAAAAIRGVRHARTTCHAFGDKNCQDPEGERPTKIASATRTPRLANAMVAARRRETLKLPLRVRTVGGRVAVFNFGSRINTRGDASRAVTA